MGIVLTTMWLLALWGFNIAGTVDSVRRLSPRNSSFIEFMRRGYLQTEHFIFGDLGHKQETRFVPFVQEMPMKFSEVPREYAYFWTFAIITYVLLVASIVKAGYWFTDKWEQKYSKEASGDDQEEVTDSDESEDELDALRMSTFTAGSATPITSPHTEIVATKREKEKRRRRIFKRAWLRDSYESMIQSGALALACIAGVMICYRIIRVMWRNPEQPFIIFQGGLFVSELMILVTLILSCIICTYRPKAGLYWSCFFLLCFHIPASMLPPFQIGCRDLEKWDDSGVAKHIGQIKNNVDCSLQGLTAGELFLFFLLTLPWVVPRHKMLKLFGGMWIFGVYVPWSVYYSSFTGEQIVSMREQCIRLTLLLAALGIAIIKKYYLEKHSLNNYVMIRLRTQAGRKMYNILSFMLPKHVIVPLLEKPDGVIAERIDVVSILFVVISDFDHFVDSYTPEELLKFLNHNFSEFDQICAEHGVTKIETVGEEYVCCVGVLPEDQGMRHSELLHRLFLVADKILKMQSNSSKLPQVKFKMGMNTGPIVAGVIGQKLPRYRLFGDTINTAARMMQKSLVGKLQFGDSTFQELPPSVQVQSRGLIEMKGKGMVSTYLFENIQRNSTASAPGKDAMGRTPSLFQSALTGAFDLGSFGPDDMDRHDQPTYEDGSPGSMYFEKQDFSSVFQQLSVATHGTYDDKFEQEWYEHYHKNTVCKKFDARMTRWIVGYILYSIGELGYMLHERIVADPDFHVGSGRFRTFLSLRSLCITILVFWRFVAYPRNWHRNNAWLAQTGLLVSLTAILILTWISYQSLTSKEKSTKQRTDVPNATNTFNAPFDQVFALNWVLLYTATAELHHLRIKSSVFLFLVVCGLMWTTEIRQEGLMFPYIGKVVFTMIASTTLVHSFVSQIRNRQLFKDKRSVEGIKGRIEDILKTLMPPHVVKELRTSVSGDDGLKLAHPYRKATIAQSDLCGFTKFASTRTPEEVVEFIGELFGDFDKLTDVYQVYKVETVGDAYIAGQAEFPLSSQNSPTLVILFGLGMVRIVTEWAQRRGLAVSCRVGIHHGECIGGIVGNDMQRYHLFGDLMSGVEVLESTAPEGAVQISTDRKSVV